MTLIERDHELAVIDQLLSDAVDRSGSVVLVEGPPGIGKTALLGAVREHGVRTLTAVGGELEQDVPFAMVRQLFEEALRTAPDDTRRELFAGAAGLAAPVFGQRDDQPPPVGDVTHGLYWLCANLAETAPLLLVVDDVHWADEPSLRFLSHLSRRVTDLPVLLLVAGRTGQLLDEVIRRALGGVRPTPILLDRLSDAAVGVLVRQALSPDADDEFCHACAVASGGNPFLLAEALTSLRADGIQPTKTAAPHVEHLAPTTVSRAVLPRIARLGQEAVRFVRALAVLGPTAQPRHLATLAGLSLSAAAVLADALAREAIITADPTIEFVHPLVRSAVHTDMTPLHRATEHATAARILADDSATPERIAPHLLAAEPEGADWVVEVLSDAATSALGRGAPEAAATYLARARTEPPAKDLRASIAARLGRALCMAARPRAAHDALRDAVALTDTPPERIMLACELGFLMMQSGQGKEAVDAAELARGMLDRHAPTPPLPVQIAFALSDITTLNLPSVWTSRLNDTVSILDGTDEMERMAMAIVAFGAVAMGDRPAGDAARLAARAVDGPLPSSAWIMVSLAGCVLAVSDHLTEALDVFDRGIDAARALGSESEYRYLTALRSHTVWDTGRLREAESDARGALEDSSGEPQSPNAPIAAAMLIDALTERGRLDEAARVLDDYQLGGDQPVDTVVAHVIPIIRARLLRRLNKPRAALDDLLDCGRTLVDGGYTNPSFTEWRAEAVLAHRALGETEAAAELAAQNLELARKFGAPRSIALALRMAGLVADGDDCLQLFAEATELLDGSPAELERAYCLVDYGAALRRAGHRKQALEPLRAGLDLAARCGAEPLAGRAIEELRTVGARPRRTAITGPDALTASELRVARIAAEGATNREIAQTLFLSKRTVEVHLTNTYRKLGIDTRQQLRSAIAD